MTHNPIAFSTDDAHDAMDDTAGLESASCPQCKGESLMLGTLGRFVQYRCRSCGWVFNARSTT